MTAVMVTECDHGLLVVAENYSHAITWLFNNGWIDRYTEMTNTIGDEITLVDDIWGANWKEQIEKMNIMTFNYWFSTYFNMKEIEIV